MTTPLYPTTVRRIVTQILGFLVPRPADSSRCDAGSAMLVAVVATVAAAGIGLVAVTAVTRSIANETRSSRQILVDQLAQSGTEEAFGRIVRDRDGLFEIAGSTDPVITPHPGYGTDPDLEVGPWVRFDDNGQVVSCEEDASRACYTIRLLTAPDLATANSAVIDVTARMCRRPDPTVSTCVRSRIQTSLRARSFTDSLIWADRMNAAHPEDVLDGPLLIGAEFPALPQPQAEDFAGLAALSYVGPTQITVDAALLEVLTVSTSAGNETPLWPYNGVIYVDGDLEILEIASIRPLTIAASGTITISGSVTSTDLITVVSTNANISITSTTDESRRIDAVLIATSTSADPDPATGIISADLSSATTLSALTLNGAVIARSVEAFSTVANDTDPRVGYRLQWTFNPLTARFQSPFGVYQVRGRWIRVDQVTVFPKG
jgi:hypothetical protein